MSLRPLSLLVLALFLPNVALALCCTGEWADLDGDGVWSEWKRNNQTYCIGLTPRIEITGPGTCQARYTQTGTNCDNAMVPDLSCNVFCSAAQPYARGSVKISCRSSYQTGVPDGAYECLDWRGGYDHEGNWVDGNDHVCYDNSDIYLSCGAWRNDGVCTGGQLKQTNDCGCPRYVPCGVPTPTPTHQPSPTT
ncbi:MAG: hypothetical protein IT290_06765, partial [Deltaproteobacteria bacterium]|nr:hypothetical protein [Deltaproteobacteria bacterium]